MRDAPPTDPRRAPRPPDYYDANRAELADLVPRSARRFLEVGAGSGSFADTLRRHCTVDHLTGIEPEDLGAPMPEYDEFHRTSFPDPELDLDGPFDCVFFNDVLEHMPDPWLGLEAARSVLVSPGWVVLSLPNVANAATIFDLVARGDWPYRSSGVLDVDHLRFFTRRSAERMLEATGFTIEEYRPLDALPLPGARVTAPLMRWRALGFRRLGFLARKV